MNSGKAKKLNKAGLWRVPSPWKSFHVDLKLLTCPIRVNHYHAIRQWSTNSSRASMTNSGFHFCSLPCNSWSNIGPTVVISPDQWKPRWRSYQHYNFLQQNRRMLYKAICFQYLDQIGWKKSNFAQLIEWIEYLLQV